MIINFYNFVLEKNSSKKSNRFKIGDYVILKDTFNPVDELSPWHDHYGIIIDRYGDKHFLVHLLSELDDEFIEYQKTYNNSDSFYYDKSTIKPTMSDIWVCYEYLIKFITKKDFDDAINEIEMTRKASKYNI